MGTFGNDSSIEGDVYLQKLATYIRRNEEGIANGLLCFSKMKTPAKAKPLRPSFTIHHLYYLTDRIESSSLGVDVGPLNIKLDTPNHEPTFISFMANNARNLRHFESDARSITSINSVKSMVSSASVYWRTFAFSKDPKVIQKDLKYLYSSFTKIPCLILNPKTKINSISGYEEFPCDTSVPLKMFKNLQVLELVKYEPNEVFGWHILSEQLRILIIRNCKVSDLTEILFSLVIDDENGRSAFNNPRQSKKHDHEDHPKYTRRERAMTSLAHSSARDQHNTESRLNPLSFSATSNERYHVMLPESKWFYLKQLSVSESSISSIPSFVFKPLQNLVKLNLSNNLLEDLPDGLEQLVNVKYMNFADNYITSLHKLPYNLKYLTTLNFNNNKITSLDGLQHSASIDKIDLRRNNLSTMAQLRPILIQVAKENSILSNVFISGNPLPKTYRVDLFNLFNGVKPKNTLKIDDSRPGYFENAILLDTDAARKCYEKFMNSDLMQPPMSPMEENIVSAPLPKSSEKKHRRNKSTGGLDEVAQAVASLNLHGLDTTCGNRKHASVMTTASSASILALTVKNLGGGNRGSLSPSPSTPYVKLTGLPLFPNQNLGNNANVGANKIPSITKQSFHSPMINQNVNGSASTLKSSSTMTRLDLDSTSIQNPAPSVITAVQVQVEGFQ